MNVNNTTNFVVENKKKLQILMLSFIKLLVLLPFVYNQHIFLHVGPLKHFMQLSVNFMCI